MRHCTYILHFDMPDGSTEHYVGNTTYDRIRKRLKDERFALPTNRVRQLYDRGGKMQLALTTDGKNESIDHALNMTKAAMLFCPICVRKTGKTVNP